MVRSGSLAPDNEKRVLWQGDGGLAARTRRYVAPERAGQANPERLLRIINGCQRDKHLDEHWLPSLLLARTLIKEGSFQCGMEQKTGLH